MISSMKPYPVMKDSGVLWLRGVPEHWKVERLKSLMSNVIEQTAKQQNGLYIALENVESWTGILKKTGFDMPFDSQVKRFQSGDVLFGRLRPYLAKVTRPMMDGVCVGEFLVLRPRVSCVTASYMEKLLRSKTIIEAINSTTFGAKMPRADWQFIGGMAIALPPLPEQEAIVRFLDHMDHRIRRYIRAKQKLIKLLEEQKQAIIHSAVTLGLDPNVPLKPSGVEWLGDVPEHWVVAALRHRYSQCLGKMLDSKKITGKYPLPYLRNIDVQWDRINIKDLPIMDISPEEYERYTIRKGDLLVCEGGDVGRCALWSDEMPLCGFQKALHRLRPRCADQDVPRFMYYLLRAAAKCDAFNDGHLSTIAHLTGDKLRAHRFSFPPKLEQEILVNFLDITLEGIDKAISSTLCEISLLHEYRARLISDVVTGKLDVRGIDLPATADAEVSEEYSDLLQCEEVMGDEELQEELPAESD